MGQFLSNLANGSLIKLTENTKPIKFIKLDNDHYGSGTGVTLIRKDTFNERPYEVSYDGDSRNRYLGSLLDNFCDGIWPLMLDDKIRECIVPVPISVAEGHGIATLHTVYRKAFALSCTEVGLSGWQAEGKAFSYFSDNAKRIACLDETTVTVYWGLRSPHSDKYNAYYVRSDGVLFSYFVYRANFAARPAFNLKSSVLVSNSTDSDGCYTVENVPSSGGGLYVKNNGVWINAL